MTESDSLTSRDYWEGVHHMHQPRSCKPWWHIPVRRWLYRGFHSHADCVRTRVLEKYLPRQGRLVEIGCAPGRALLMFRTRFGLEPFGVEYSDSGYRATVAEFERQRVDSRGVIRGDFTDPKFRSRYREHFDVVFSNGLIEHFVNPAAIVGYHVELLKPGGHLVVVIPNLRGLLYHPVLSLTCPDILAIHNLSIMRLSEFHTLFTNQPLDVYYCDYVGTVSLPLMVRPQPNRILKTFFVVAQAVFDILFVNILRHRDLHNRFTSPYLLYIGIKRGGSR